MITNGNILIVDDKREDGKLVAEAIWNNNSSCYFYCYDTENFLADKAKLRKHTGVRIIFQDIQLVNGTGTPNTTDYDAATDIIDTLLSDQNGPWLLITWSTWCNPEGIDDGIADKKYPTELFEHLKNELPEKKQPFAVLTLDKSTFTNATHSPVKDDITVAEIENLSQQITDLTPPTPHLDAMWKWEYRSRDMAAGVISDMASLAQFKTSTTEVDTCIDNFDNRFSWMLHTLAHAEAGKTDNSQLLTQSIEAILHSLQLDRSKESLTIPQEIFDSPPPPSTITTEATYEWKRRMNKILHFDFSNRLGGTPGTIFEYNTSIPSPILNNQETCCYLFDNFFKRLTDKTPVSDGEDITPVDSYKLLFDKSQLVLVDVTAPCDLAQEKAELRKFCIGIELTIPNFGHISNSETREKKIGKFIKRFRQDSYWISPTYSTKEGCLDTPDIKVIVLDLCLVYSIPGARKKLEAFKVIGRIKEQLHRELTNSLGNHMVRPGIVCFTQLD